jgi:hypothetical protein
MSQLDSAEQPLQRSVQEDHYLASGTRNPKMNYGRMNSVAWSHWSDPQICDDLPTSTGLTNPLSDDR